MATIRYDEDGTKTMTVWADHISSQMWWCGRTQTCMAVVMLSDRGRGEFRTIQFAAVYTIDVDRTEGAGM